MSDEWTKPLSDSEKRIYRKGVVVQLLVDDFKKMYPDSSHAERREILLRLSGFELEDLELLLTQVTP